MMAERLKSMLYLFMFFKLKILILFCLAITLLDSAAYAKEIKRVITLDSLDKKISMYDLNC